MSESARHDALAKSCSDDSRSFQRLVSALLIDRLQAARGDTNTHKLLQLRDPNTLAVQIRCENPRYCLRDVPAYAAFFLGQTAPVNHAATCNS